MKKSDALIPWQIEFSRPFKGMLKVFGNHLIYDKRVLKIICTGRAIIELGGNVKFTAKVARGENGKNQTFMVNKSFEKTVRDSMREMGREFFIYDDFAENYVIEKSNQNKNSEIKIKNFVVDQISKEVLTNALVGKGTKKYYVEFDKNNERRANGEIDRLSVDRDFERDDFSFERNKW